MNELFSPAGLTSQVLCSNKVAAMVSNTFRPGETGQDCYCMPNTIVSVLKQALHFCPQLMIQKQTIMFARQC